jgi:hypothetical protein
MENRKYQDQQSIRADLRRGLELGGLDKDVIDYYIEHTRDFIARRTGRGLRFVPPFFDVVREFEVIHSLKYPDADGTVVVMLRMHTHDIDNYVVLFTEKQLRQMVADMERKHLVVSADYSTAKKADEDVVGDASKPTT